MLVGEIALLTDMEKHTITYVKCCTDPVRLFGRIFTAFV